tara:strand:+ start:292 stop:537 length:246 start_codon:yes stop_codon:yes gene_type:complete
LEEMVVLVVEGDYLLHTQELVDQEILHQQVQHKDLVVNLPLLPLHQMVVVAVVLVRQVELMVKVLVVTDHLVFMHMDQQIQ